MANLSLQGKRMFKVKDEIIRLYKNGIPGTKIAEIYKVHIERIYEVLSESKVGIKPRKIYKAKANINSPYRLKKKILNQERLDKICLEKNGCSFGEYKNIAKLSNNKAYEAYRTQRKHAARRGVSWELNFFEWWSVWQQSGKWSQRGNAKKKYVMSRHNDIGPYKVGNISIITLSQNSKDAYIYIGN